LPSVRSSLLLYFISADLGVNVAHNFIKIKDQNCALEGRTQSRPKTNLKKGQYSYVYSHDRFESKTMFIF